MPMIEHRRRWAGAAVARMLDWPMRRILRRWGLPDIPEVRRLMRTAWHKGFCWFGAVPSQQEMRTIREQSLAAVSRALPDKSDASNVDQTSAEPSGTDPPISPAIIREAVHEEIQACWSATLPPPETLAEYNDTIPGTAERILCMAEGAVACKVHIRTMLAGAELETAKTGLKIAFGLNLLSFAASVVSFALRHQLAGIAFVAFSMVTLIKSLISA